MILTRRESGKLALNSLDVEIFFGDLFDLCNTEKEVDWLEEQLRGIVENIAEENRERLEK